MSSRPLEKFAPEGLPEGWRQMRIGEAIEEASSPIEMRADEEYLLASIRRRFGGMFHRERLYGREILTKNLQRVVPGSFVIARMQIVHGACALVDEQFQNHVISKSYSSFKSTEHCDTRFFSKLAEQPFMTEYFRDASHGVVIEKMTFQQDRWLEFPVWLPPVEEQRRIAEILDAIDEAIQATERVIAKLRANANGLISDAAEGALEAGRIRSLGEIADESPGSLIQTGPFGSQLHASEYVSEGTPAFMPTDIKEGELDVERAAKISAKKADELGRHRLRVGDVLFARRGDLSRCAVVAAEQSGGLCGTGCLLVRIPKEALAPDWLAAIYRHDTVQWQVLARAVGSTMLNLSASLIRSLLIPCPTQTSRRLMTVAHATSGRVEIERTDLAKLVVLRAGIAADLLSGRVRTVAA